MADEATMDYRTVPAGARVFGIPQSLFYWQHEPLWKTFFHELGLTLVSSGKTTLKITKEGVIHSEDESCFSYKVLFGHIVSLAGKVDVIFLPSYLSIKKNFLSCPKFAGIGDVARCLKLKGTRIFSPIIDLRKKSLSDHLLTIGSSLGCARSRVVQASEKALHALEDREKENTRAYHALVAQEGRKVILFCHQYVALDESVNMRIQDKLGKSNIIPIPIHLAPRVGWDPDFLWDFVAEEVAKLKAIDRESIAGIIQLSSFNCGPDSIVTEYVHDFCREAGIPFLSILLDEQTGEAGLETRLEAFFDTLCFFSAKNTSS